MKLTGIILFMLLSVQLYAQQVNGIVLDKATGQPIPGAVVKKGSTIQLSSANGNFTLTSPHIGDSVRFTLLGYQTYYLVLGAPGKDTIRVYLVPNSILLNSVNIRARHDPKIDSLQNRKEFANVFSYTAPTFMDAFVKVDPYAYVPNNYITAPNSTTSLVGIDLLSIAGLFGKNKTPASKLHQLALDNEKINYIDQRFSKEKIVELTNLHGDALADFMYLYRPEIGTLKKMSEYDLVRYIKKSFDQYKAGKPNVPAIK
jgi:hypothetical protein